MFPYKIFFVLLILSIVPITGYVYNEKGKLQPVDRGCLYDVSPFVLTFLRFIRIIANNFI